MNRIQGYSDQDSDFIVSGIHEWLAGPEQVDVFVGCQLVAPSVTGFFQNCRRGKAGNCFFSGKRMPPGKTPQKHRNVGM